MHSVEHNGRKVVVLAGRSDAPKEALLSAAAGLSSSNSQTVRVLNADRVFGADHLRSALQKAARAFENGQNVSDSLATETMLYMSGCRQIQEAVELFGLKAGGGAVVVIADDANGIEEKLRGLPVREQDSVMSEIAGKELSAFGVTPAEADSVPEKMRLDLVLERVAGVDIKKK